MSSSASSVATLNGIHRCRNKKQIIGCIGRNRRTVSSIPPQHMKRSLIIILLMSTVTKIQSFFVQKISQPQKMYAATPAFIGLSGNINYFGNHIFPTSSSSNRMCLFSSSVDENSVSTSKEEQQKEAIVSIDESSSDNRINTTFSPWNKKPALKDGKMSKRQKQNTHRFRQHVNPLSRRYQQPTMLSNEWPKDVFDDLSKPLFLDIGCSKGGFLLDLVSNSNSSAKIMVDKYNYIGLEIRPLVAQYANERLQQDNNDALIGKLNFIGCNANFDLERILARYKEASTSKNIVDIAAIQFPDPHFKTQHHKRRVVTPELIQTLSKYMTPKTGTLFFQSDIKVAFDDMRNKFLEYGGQYFHDQYGDKYVPDNIIGIPTEREVSVIEKNLPVFRAVFKRNDSSFNAK